MEKIVRVKIADYAVLKEKGMLITIGLGSCVGIALYDSPRKVAGLAHILLADSTQFSKRENLAKYADTAIPLLLEDMLRLGARKERVKAKIAGGSELFNFKSNKESVGARNIKAVKKNLALLNIPLLAADVEGKSGRTMKFFAEDGKVLIAHPGTKEKEL